MGAPLLNPSLRPLVIRKWTGTLTGGWKIPPLTDTETPIVCTVAAFHLFAFFIPVAWGLSLSALNNPALAAILNAVGMFLFVILIQSGVKLLQKRNLAEGFSDFTSEDEISGPCLSTAYLFTFSLDGKGNGKSWLKIFITAFVSGVLMSGCSYYLTSATLVTHFGSGLTAALVFGWLTVCITQWGLTAAPPAEPFTFHTDDVWGIDDFTRQFYLTILLVLGIFSTQIVFLPPLSYAGIHAVFCILPILFSVGFIPSLRITIMAVVEGVQKLLLSSPSFISARRDTLGFAVSFISVAIILALTGSNALELSDNRVYILTSVFGAACGSRSWFHFIMLCISRLSATDDDSASSLLYRDAFKEKGIVEIFDGFIRVGISVALVFMTSMPSAVLLSNAQAVIIALTVAWITARELQSQFFPSFWPCFRNTLHTPGKSRQGILCTLLGSIYSLSYSIVPYVGGLWIIVKMMTDFQNLGSPPASSNIYFTLWFTIVLLRGLRRMWQSTCDASIELCLVLIVNAIAGQGGDSSFSVTWNGFLTATQFLIVYLVKEYVVNVLTMGHYWIIALVYYLRNRKQRRKAWPIHLAASLICSPIAIGICAALGNPLIAFLGLPILLVGFARPARLWPSSEKQYSTGPDAVMYENMASSILESISRDASAGRIPGLGCSSLYLARFESRILMIRVVEQWFDGVTVVLTGAELEPTSCHALEGAHVDVILDNGLGSDMELATGTYKPSSILANVNWGSSLQPIGIVYASGFDETKIALQGLIDDAGLIKNLPIIYARVLVYVLLGTFDGRDLTQIAKMPLTEQMFQFCGSKFDPTWVDKLGKLHLFDGKNYGGSSEDFSKNLRRIVAACYIVQFGIGKIVSTLVDTSIKNAGQIYSTYRGDLPYSLAEVKSWFTAPEQLALRQASLLAFRICVKTSIEMVVDGSEWSDLESLLGFVKENWVMWHFSSGDSDLAPKDEASTAAAWKYAIQQGGKTSIYTLLKKSDGTFYERRMVKRPNCRIRLGQLNGEAAKAIWANQTLELLYLNSDDDERYSIQANEMLLRNLTVSTAPSPFGYPIWVTSARIDRQVGYLALLLSCYRYVRSLTGKAVGKISPEM